jgi:hypothetical protein
MAFSICIYLTFKINAESQILLMVQRRLKYEKEKNVDNTELKVELYIR